MTIANLKMPRQIIVICVFWVILGIYNLWISFQGLSSDLEVWYLLSDASVHQWVRMAIPAEAGINVIVIFAAIIQLLTVPLIMIKKPVSIKLAIGVFIAIALLNLISGALYASAPSELSADLGLTSAIFQSFGLGIFQLFLISFFWKALNNSEVKNYFRINAPTVLQTQLSSDSVPSNKRYCRYCGVENELDASFCEKCGRNIG